MPEELWAEVCDIVQQAIPIPKKRNAKRHSGSQEDLQIAMKRREAKRMRKGKTYPFECKVPKNSKKR